MPTANEIRQQFIDFFVKKHGHTAVPSSPVVPFDDPTLLFTNAGMNQFKDVFLGTGTRPFVRAVDTQKCIRAGGKHNDLDDVGKDTYHHTFFEMLGNWSFGDYFKKEAIAWAWELLTKEWKLDPSRLHVTVFEGDPEGGVPRDEEAATYWRDVAGVHPDHIHYFGKKDNFWEMGETGPCGPCTEIHVDRTPDKSGAKLVNRGSPEVMEIWNLVFIQYNRNADKSLTPLPAKHVDTGMGFERITAVLQGKTSNYDTDVFTPIFQAIREVTGAPPYGGKLDDLKDTAYRVIADHVRMATFAISDGAKPGSNERDAVLRRVILRAFRFGYQHFKLRTPFLFRLVDVIVKLMSSVFPELKANQRRVESTIQGEEISFLERIDSAFYLFEKGIYDQIGKAVAPPNCRYVRWESIAEHIISVNDFDEANSKGRTTQFFEYKAENGEFIRKTILGKSIPEVLKYFNLNGHDIVLEAKTAFELHSAKGLFVDIQEQMAAELGVVIDKTGFDALFNEFKNQSASKQKKHTVKAIEGTLPSTDDKPKYQAEIIDAKVLGWVKDNVVVCTGTLQPGESVALLLDRTPFYGEQGGQVGDTGIIRTEGGADFEVDDTQRLGDAILHIGRLEQGRLGVGDSVKVQTAVVRRMSIMKNHTATHLLNLALRHVLGQHVEQKGSLVDDEKTRFDFTHDKPLSADEIQRIEEKVNLQVFQDLPVTPTVMPLSEAKKIPGVRAVFGEKYPDPVRVVMIGPDSPATATPDDSVEFCGGTHLPRTGTIGLFKITSQEGVAKGVRRITATTGRHAFLDAQKRSAILDELSGQLHCRPDEVGQRVAALQDELKKLQQQLKKGAASDLNGAVDKLLAEAHNSKDSKLIVGAIPAAGSDAIRAQVDRLRSKVGSCAVILGWDDEGKVGLLAGVTDDLVKKGLHAGKLVGEAAKIVDGKGGGNPTLAQAGGKNPAKLTEALDRARTMAHEIMEK